jgi:hypothetical protein
MRKIKSWKTFQSSYITEEVAWTGNIINHIADCVPLTDTIVKLIFDNKRTTAFHITDATHALGRSNAIMNSESDTRKEKFLMMKRLEIQVLKKWKKDIFKYQKKYSKRIKNFIMILRTNLNRVKL